MASGVTVHQQPAAYSPAHMPLIFEATSTNIAQPNFAYTIIVTDLITSATQTYPHEQRPVTGECVFDARDFVKDFIKNYIPNNVYGFQKCTDAIRKIRVNIGETYGATPAYTAGSNIDFIVWNGGMSWLEFPSYASSNYVYTAATPNIVYLSNLINRKTFSGASLFLYVLTSTANDVGLIRITTYDSANNAIGTSDIANPYVASTTYTDKYLCIDVGHKGLSNISAGLVTGAYPIITASVAYYTVQDVTTVGVIPVQTTQVTDIYRVDVGCEAKHDVYALHYLDKKGNFETLICPKFSEITTKNKKTTYRQQPFTLASNTWAYTKFTGHEKVQSTEEDQSYTVTTDWLSETEAALFAHIIHAGVVYHDMGSSIGLVPVIVETNSMIRPKKWNQPRMRAIQISFRYTFKEVWQHD